MGWIGGYESAHAIKFHLEQNFKNNTTVKLIKICSTTFGRHIWVAYEDSIKVRRIMMCLVQKNQGEFSSKEMGEDCGPCYYDCPLELLDITEQSGITRGKISQDWRAKVRQYWKDNHKEKQDIVPGEIVEIFGKRYKVIERLKRSWKVQSLDNGGMYKASSRKIKKLSPSLDFIINTTGANNTAVGH